MTRTFSSNETTASRTYTFTVVATNYHGTSGPVQITVTQPGKPIASSYVRVTAPATDVTPNPTVLSCGSGNVTCLVVRWLPKDSPFKDNTRYTVQVTMKANDGSVFATNFSATINGQDATVTRTNNTTVTLSYEFPATAKAINSADISLPAPAIDETPKKAVSTCGANFTCKTVIWVPYNNPFKGRTRYTAQVTLKANTGYVFATNFSATINGQDATVTRSNNTTVELSYSFPATSAPRADDIAILAQPTRLHYADGDALELSGLVVRLSFNDGTTENVPLADFAVHSLITEPVEGTVLSAALHTGTGVTVRYGGLPPYATTEPLEVTAKVTEPQVAAPISSGTTPMGGLVGGCNTTGGPFEWVALLAFAALVWVRRPSRSPFR